MCTYLLILYMIPVDLKYQVTFSRTNGRVLAFCAPACLRKTFLRMECYSDTDRLDFFKQMKKNVFSLFRAGPDSTAAESVTRVSMVGHLCGDGLNVQQQQWVVAGHQSHCLVLRAVFPPFFFCSVLFCLMHFITVVGPLPISRGRPNWSHACKKKSDWKCIWVPYHIEGGGVVLCSYWSILVRLIYVLSIQHSS